MKKTIESKVADAILQRERTIKIGDKTYQVAPPSTATLILVSELVAQMPVVDSETKQTMTESLRIARDCKVIGDIIATMILGAKALKNKRKFFSRSKAKAELAEEILLNIKPSDLYVMTQELLQGMEISFFFGISTFLSAINLTKPTKPTREETIQSGPLSQE